MGLPPEIITQSKRQFHAKQSDLCCIATKHAVLRGPKPTGIAEHQPGTDTKKPAEPKV
tara:strand:+ start:45138 stop:45311 length:174 start_codon:yes stop_codon:yes gene_type:complete